MEFAIIPIFLAGVTYFVTNQPSSKKLEPVYRYTEVDKDLILGKVNNDNNQQQVQKVNNIRIKKRKRSRQLSRKSSRKTKDSNTKEKIVITYAD